MSKKIDDITLAKLEEMANKLNIDIDTIVGEFDEFSAMIRKQLTGLNEKELVPRIVKLFKQKYRNKIVSASRSPAKTFIGMVIGDTGTRDYIAQTRRRALNNYLKNPDVSIDKCEVEHYIKVNNGFKMTSSINGIQVVSAVPPEAIPVNGNENETTEWIVPLDTRERFQSGDDNPEYGNPLPKEKLRRTIHIMYAPNLEEQPVYKVMTLKDELTKLDIPLFEPISFKAIEFKTKNGEEILTGSQTQTTFRRDESVRLPRPDELIESRGVLSKLYSPLGSLEMHHEKAKDNYNRLVLTVGDASCIMMEETSIGSRRVFLDNDDIPWDDDEGNVLQNILAWVPGHIPIDFGEHSRIIVAARTDRQPARDNDGNIIDGEDGDICLNVLGIWPIPEYKISPEFSPEPLTIQDLKLED